MVNLRTIENITSQISGKMITLLNSPRTIQNKPSFLIECEEAMSIPLNDGIFQFPLSLTPL